MPPTFLPKWKIILRVLGIYFWSQTFSSRTTAGILETGRQSSIIASWSPTKKVLVHCNLNQETAPGVNQQSYPYSTEMEVSSLETFPVGSRFFTRKQHLSSMKRSALHPKNLTDRHWPSLYASLLPSQPNYRLRGDASGDEVAVPIATQTLI